MDFSGHLFFGPFIQKDPSVSIGKENTCPILNLLAHFVIKKSILLPKYNRMYLRHFYLNTIACIFLLVLQIFPGQFIFLRKHLRTTSIGNIEVFILI